MSSDALGLNVSIATLRVLALAVSAQHAEANQSSGI